jgi:ribose/xylose/arabinose/galactoside ABC-type transport system permease subunit
VKARDLQRGSGSPPVADQLAELTVTPLSVAESPRARRARRRERLSYIGTPIAFLVLFVGVFGIWLGHVFLNASARLFDIYQSGPTLIVSLGLLVCLVAGQFDLSVANLATLVTILVVGLRTRQGWPFPVVILVCLGVGVAAGFLNGFIVTRFKINPFISTLGTGGLFTGLADVYSHGEPITSSLATHPLPSWFTGVHSFGSFLEKAPAVADWAVAVLLGLAAAAVIVEQYVDRAHQLRTRLLVATDVIMTGLGGWLLTSRANWSILLVLLLGLLVWAALRYTVFGRSLYGVGGNRMAARFAGIRVERHLAGSFMIAGLFAGIAGIVLAANQGSAAPGIADGYLLPAYAATFLSTVMFSAGRFHVWGTILGGLALAYVGEGLIEGGVSFTWTPFVNGFVLIAAVAASTLLRRRGDGGH